MTYPYQVRIVGRLSRPVVYDACASLADAQQSADEARQERKIVLGIWRWDNGGWMKV